MTSVPREKPQNRVTRWDASGRILTSLDINVEKLKACTDDSIDPEPKKAFKETQCGSERMMASLRDLS